MSCAVAVTLTATLAGCGGSKSTAPTTTSDTISHISPIPMTIPPGQAAPPSSSACDPAPARLVDMINDNFTDGQRLEDVAALDAPSASVYIAGNIYNSSGMRDSSHNAWLYRDGTIYALTKDARRDTLFTDGRDLVPDFFSSDAWSALGECINAAARAAGK